MPYLTCCPSWSLAMNHVLLKQNVPVKNHGTYLSPIRYEEKCSEIRVRREHLLQQIRNAPTVSFLPFGWSSRQSWRKWIESMTFDTVMIGFRMTWNSFFLFSYVFLISKSQACHVFKRCRALKSPNRGSTCVKRPVLQRRCRKHRNSRSCCTVMARYSGRAIGVGNSGHGTGISHSKPGCSGQNSGLNSFGMFSYKWVECRVLNQDSCWQSGLAIRKSYRILMKQQTNGAFYTVRVVGRTWSQHLAGFIDPSRSARRGPVKKARLSILLPS